VKSIINNKKLIFISLLIFVSLNAKIIEVEQLFNKKITKVKEENISIEKSFYGITQIDESKIIDITTRFDGFITKLNANKNYMNVEKNTALFSIYSKEIQSIQDEIKIARSVNKNLYKSSLEKLKVLNISNNEINKLKKAKISSNGIKIYSPINGIILNKSVNDFSFIKKGMRLFQIANIDKLWFIAKVYQKDLNFIKKDMEALIKIDGIKNSIKSKVDFIYPIVNENTKTIDVRFILDNKEFKIYPKMFASVQIKQASKNILTLPKTAVLTKGDSFYVFKALSSKEFEPIKIEAKRISSNKYEILDGLQKGEEVINNALFLLDSDAVTNSLYESDDEQW